MMQRWCSRLRLLASLHSIPKPYHDHSRRRYLFVMSNRLLHTSPNLLHKSHIVTPSVTSLNSNPLRHAPAFPHFAYSPLSLTQVRHITAKQRKRKLKSRKPMTPVTSKVKKIKIKCYSSFKGRFRIMNDGQIRRWKEGKRHNAKSKSKKAKRRLRQPAIVPLAYSKVMKKLNFCG